MLSVTIVGFGITELSIIERLSKKLAGKFTEKLHIVIFDSHSLGFGCHDSKQPASILANTVSSQMSIFCDESVCPNEFFIKGPSFYEFLIARGIKAQKNGYYARALLGEYLQYSFEFIKKLCPNDIIIEIIKEKAKEIDKRDSQFIVKSKNFTILSDSVFVTTGHAQQEKTSEEYPAYPLDNAVQGLSSKDTVAIKGLGLSAIDIITLLTSGRGGHFEEKDGELTYIPSHNEPKILAFSRSNIPLMARAITQKETREQYIPLFFTKDVIIDLQKRHGRLDFKKQILPLIIKEMEYVYSYTYIARQSQEQSFLFRNAYILAKNPQDILDTYIPKNEQFDFHKLIYPIDNAKDSNDFKLQMIAYLENDIKEAKLGNLTSPIKSACDVLRDVRDTIRLCIDFSGITQDSYNFFMKSFVPLNNRLCVGPPLIRIQELLALMKAGIVEILYNAKVEYGHHDNCRIIDGFNTSHEATRLINARIDSLRLKDDEFLSSILSNNLGSTFNNNGIESECFCIDKHFRSIKANGEITKNLFIIGLPTEGIKFYTFILPRPHIQSTFLQDCNNAVDSLVQYCKD